MSSEGLRTGYFYCQSTERSCCLHCLQIPPESALKPLSTLDGGQLSRRRAAAGQGLPAVLTCCHGRGRECHPSQPVSIPLQPTPPLSSPSQKWLFLTSSHFRYKNFHLSHLYQIQYVVGLKYPHYSFPQAVGNWAAARSSFQKEN